MSDQYDLERFVSAQDGGGTYARAEAELRGGHKTSHWMWFVFPQIQGLGRTSTARRYEIASLAEARAYLQHPVLGPRLRECAGLVLALAERRLRSDLLTDRSATDILGDTDAMKLRSSMTLFLRAAPSEPIFAQVLDQFFDGVPDGRTDRLLSGS